MKTENYDYLLSTIAEVEAQLAEGHVGGARVVLSAIIKEVTDWRNALDPPVVPFEELERKAEEDD